MSNMEATYEGHFVTSLFNENWMKSSNIERFRKYKIVGELSIVENLEKTYI